MPSGPALVKTNVAKLFNERPPRGRRVTASGPDDDREIVANQPDRAGPHRSAHYPGGRRLARPGRAGHVHGPRAVAAALFLFHAFASGQLRGPKTTGLCFGRLFLPDGTVLLTEPVRTRVAAYLDYRNHRQEVVFSCCFLPESVVGATWRGRAKRRCSRW